MATVLRAPLFTPPRSRSVSRVPHTAQADVTFNTRPLLAALPRPPFTQADWPNPLSKDTKFPIDNRTDIDPWEYWLLKDKFFGGAGQPPSPFSQPNPRGRTASADLFTIADGTEFWLLTGQQAPFAQTDWPNPTTRQPATLETRTQADGTEYWLLTPIPWTPVDAPNPRGPAFPISLRTDTHDLNRLAGLDQFFGAPGQSPHYDWPNPRVAVPLHRGQTASSPFWLSPTASPFGQTEWPNPTQPVRATFENRTQADGTEYWLLAPTPFSVSDWPNPVRLAARAGSTWFKAPGLIPSVPFAQTDWPLAPRKRFLHPGTWTVDLQTTTFRPVSALPFVQTQWPNPGRRDTRMVRHGQSAHLFLGLRPAQRMALLASYQTRLTLVASSAPQVALTASSSPVLGVGVHSDWIQMNWIQHGWAE